jgi:hypothetical protein
MSPTRAGSRVCDLPVENQSPSQLGAWFAREAEKWAKPIREQNIELD